MDGDNLDDLSYAKLQAMAKSFGIKANKKKDELKELIREKSASDSTSNLVPRNNSMGKRKAEKSPEDEPVAKAAKLSPKKVSSESKSSSPSTSAGQSPDKENNPNASVGQLRLASVLTYLAANPRVREEGISKAIIKLLDTWQKSNDLRYQQTIYGDCLLKPLPLGEALTFENFFSTDIITTPLYKDFKNFVTKIKSSTTAEQLQLGAVVQVSGYGKTHLARVYTRQNRAIYMKFSERTGANNFFDKIYAKISALKRQCLDADPKKRTGEEYLDFTTKAREAVELFLLAAIEHYVFFYHRLQSLNNLHLSDDDVTAICALLFENGCARLFLSRVDEYWKKLDGDDEENKKWIEDLRTEIMEMAVLFDIKAIFCDEVHALQHMFIGEFTHTSPPNPEWPKSLWAERAAYEQFIAVSPESKDDKRFAEHVRNAFLRSTSLTYLFVAALERISKANKISCIMLTTYHAAIDYTQESPTSSRGRAMITDFKFQRDHSADALRFNELIRSHFGVDILEYLKNLPDFKQINETFGTRAVYFELILRSIIGSAQDNKLSRTEIASHLQTIWSDAEKLLIDQANDYLVVMKAKNQTVFNDVAYATLFHNGYMQNNFVMKDMDIGYVPTTREELLQVKEKKEPRYRITDYWMYRALLASATADTYLKALQHAYRIVDASGPFGEDLMKYIVMNNRDKPFSYLAAPNSTFHEESIVHHFTLQVLVTGTVSEFGLTDMELLKNPTAHLKNRLIKVSDEAKADGLAISENNNCLVISAWQSKNWSSRCEPANVEKALQSLDPKIYFKSTSNNRKVWNGTRKDNLWRDNFIRVIWATDFTTTAIAQINEYNNDKANITRPVILMAHNLLPPELASKYIGLPQKQETPRKTTNKYFYGMQ